jgi:hypothetical protein
MLHLLLHFWFPVGDAVRAACATPRADVDLPYSFR